MGNSVSGSKDRHLDESVDFGALVPQGVYTGSQDWNQRVVGHLIVERRMAPFYRPLEDYEEDWDDDRILAARRENPNPHTSSPLEPSAASSSTSSKFHRNPHRTGKEPFRPTEASIYRGAVECPICFLYYPPNINRSRCCDQAICTECFVQIKRAEPTTTHIVSEPASCPYCVQENFGVIYEPPSWRTGLMSDGAVASRQHHGTVNSPSSAESERSKRRRSFGADSPEVVTIDQIRPDWEAKLAAVRAAATRRANRRIIMRQVGDRLIPIGVTSGRGLGDSEGITSIAEGLEGNSGRRSSRRRHQGGQELNHLLGAVGIGGIGGIGGQDLEELMVMEAMRQSLIEHERQQQRQANSNLNASGEVTNHDGSGNGDTLSSPEASPRPSPPTSSGTSQRPARPPSPASRTTPHQSSVHPNSAGPSSALNNAVNPFISAAAEPSGSSQSIIHPPPALYTSGTAGESLQPPFGRTHRRSGSNPGPPSSTTLAAALSAVQTATAFLNPSTGRAEDRDRHMYVPRSAPETRAGSPRPAESGVSGAQMRPLAPAIPSQAPSVPKPMLEPNAASSENAQAPYPTANVETPPSDKSDLLRGREECKPLPSAEAGDPLSDWNN